MVMISEWLIVKTWEEVGIAWFEVLFHNLPKGLRKFTKNFGIAGVPALIRTRHVTTTIQQHYRALSNVFGKLITDNVGRTVGNDIHYPQMPFRSMFSNLTTTEID
jgi:hypothetical protein